MNHMIGQIIESSLTVVRVAIPQFRKHGRNQIRKKDASHRNHKGNTQESRKNPQHRDSALLGRDDDGETDAGPNIIRAFETKRNHCNIRVLPPIYNQT